MAVDDVVAAKRVRRAILGRETVTGDYVHDPECAEYWKSRSVDWWPCAVEIELIGEITA